MIFSSSFSVGLISLIYLYICFYIESEILTSVYYLGGRQAFYGPTGVDLAIQPVPHLSKLSMLSTSTMRLNLACGFD